VLTDERDASDADLEEALGEEDAADAAEGEAIIPGLPHNLLLRHKLFAEHYVRCFNGTRAAEEAGYRGNRKTLGVRACKLLKNPKIKSYVAHLMAPDADKIDAAYIKRQIFNESLTAAHSRDRLKGWELLGRSVGMYMDVHQHEVSKFPPEVLIATLAKFDPPLARQLAPLLGIEDKPPLETAAGEGVKPPSRIAP
jgi:hypothetical protein